MRRELVLGGPGSGKTHTLLETVDRELLSGVRPHSIAFVSFTRRAVKEATARAVKKFSLSEAKLPLFRTLHSLCFMQLGMRVSQVLGKENLRELGKLLGVSLSGRVAVDDESSLVGDKMLFVDNLARASERPLADVWHECGGIMFVPWPQQKRFSATYRQYKLDRHVSDFTDILQDFVDKGAPVGARVAIIDEAQDLTSLQWRVVDLAFADCDRVYIAGDDDQAIYEWAGADVSKFVSLSVDSVRVLPVSYRIPRKLFSLAETIAGQISQRYSKRWGARDAEGVLNRCQGLFDLDLTEGSWLVLARNRCFLGDIEKECMRQGVLYSTRRGNSVRAEDIRAARLFERASEGQRLSGAEAELVAGRMGVPHVSREGQTYLLHDVARRKTGRWYEEFFGMPYEQIEYYRSVLRRGTKVTDAPRVHVDTVHGVKGGEADSVVVFPDQTARTEDGALRRPDSEHRVFYVAVTRAKKSLHVVCPRGSRFYNMPWPEERTDDVR
jgi:superfamily I DNA/RNA helicase